MAGFLAISQNIMDGDYAGAVKNSIPLLTSRGSPTTDDGADCVDALEDGDAGDAMDACGRFAKDRASDPQAQTAFGLALLLTGDTEAAFTQIDRAAKLEEPFGSARMISIFARAGQDGALDGYDLPHLPATAQSALDRALIEFKSGKFTAAAQDFQTAYDGGAKAGKVPLMLFVSQKRAGVEPTIALANDLNKEAGYQMLVRALTGKMSSKESLRQYRLDWHEDDSAYAANRFFLGEAALINGDKAEAIRFFKKAAAASKLGQIESDLAAAELARLEPQ